MTTGSTDKRLWRRWWLVALSFVACFALAACGPLGDEDEGDPTATSETIAQPTDEITVETTDVTETESAELSVSTPVMPSAALEGTAVLEPIRETPSTSAPDSTPVFNDVNTTASPVVGPEATPEAQTPTPGSNDLPLPEGDGTSGAFPGSEGTPSGESLLVEETPTTAEVGTPSSSPVALAGSLAELSVTTVSSCEPESVPAIALESTAFITVSDVNVRFGPGADCDALAISPIGEFLPVTVIGGPVQREGEDFVWVQVEVVGETGWIVTGALEPAGS